jgi:hypothetical protein
VEQIPHDQYEEWLIFDHPAEVEQFETMVNFAGFSPVDFDWEKKRERFWEQVARLHPQHVVAENDGLYLVSRDERLVSAVLGAEPSGAPNSRSPTPLPTSSQARVSDSLRTPSSGGCG